MDNPDRVSRVTPPKTIMAKTMAATANSQAATILCCLAVMWVSGMRVSREPRARG